MLGHEAGYYIPDRLLEGYGPSGEALVRLAGEGSSLIVTVDCGAMAHEALAMAHDAGVDVIVVDHHKCSAELPRAAALVNPNRLDESDVGAAHGHLAAVGVAFLLAWRRCARCAQRGYFAGRPSRTCSACSIWSRWARWPMSPRCTASTARWWRKG
jgi:single-stranded-DNA-specific exonuclease